MGILNGQRSQDNPSPSVYRYQWPYIPQPTRAERDLWRHGVQVAFEISVALRRTQPTLQPIWVGEAISWSRWLYSSSTKHVYEKEAAGQWRLWKKLGVERNMARTRRTLNRYQQVGVVTVTPLDVNVISIERQGRYIIYQGCDGFMAREGHVYLDRAVEESEVSTSSDLFLHNIRHHQGIIISDGSYDKGAMTYAFMAQPRKFEVSLETLDFSTIISGSGYGYGEHFDSNSYRAELTGILESIKFTNNLCHAHNITHGSCTLYCDNKGALIASFGHKRPTPRWSSYDLVWRIRHALRESTISWKYAHVKGHQDTKIAFPNLDYIAQGNVIVDYLASQQRQVSPPRYSTQAWVPEVNGIPVAGNTESQLMEQIYRPLMKERWGTLFGISPREWSNIEWELFFRSVSTQQKQIQPFMTKYNARLLPVGQNLKRRRHSESDRCPCCGEQETHEHLLQCTHREMEDTFRETVNDILTYLQGGSHNIVRKLILGLLEYFRSKNDADNDSQLGELYESQKALGHRAFFAGLWI